jgi:hypothetical protein
MFEDHCYPEKKYPNERNKKTNILLDQELLEVQFEHLHIFLVLYDKQLVHLKEVV